MRCNRMWRLMAHHLMEHLHLVCRRIDTHRQRRGLETKMKSQFTYENDARTISQIEMIIILSLIVSIGAVLLIYFILHSPSFLISFVFFSVPWKCHFSFSAQKTRTEYMLIHTSYNTIRQRRISVFVFGVRDNNLKIMLIVASTDDVHHVSQGNCREKYALDGGDGEQQFFLRKQYMKIYIFPIWIEMSFSWRAVSWHNELPCASIEICGWILGAPYPECQHAVL